MSTADLKGIAAGIGEALSTTIVGLAIAITALIAFSYFSRRVERLAVEMEALLIDLIEKIFHGNRGPEAFAPERSSLENATR
jgi:biopolymer transport protein ExbB